MEQEQVIPTRPYFIRAIYEWCTDNGFTPYLAVKVDEHVQVPIEYVKNGEVVLNIGFTATADLDLGNDYIRFQARFAGSARQLVIPVNRVIAIYARENGQGMAFPMEELEEDASSPDQVHSPSPSLHIVEEDMHPSKDSLSSPDSEGHKDKPKKPTLRIVD